LLGQKIIVSRIFLGVGISSSFPEKKFWRGGEKYGENEGIEDFGISEGNEG